MPSSLPVFYTLVVLSAKQFSFLVKHHWWFDKVDTRIKLFRFIVVTTCVLFLLYNARDIFLVNNGFNSIDRILLKINSNESAYYLLLLFFCEAILLISLLATKNRIVVLHQMKNVGCVEVKSWTLVVRSNLIFRQFSSSLGNRLNLPASKEGMPNTRQVFVS